jgi:transcriptional regulator with XRE-family HTH domain
MQATVSELQDAILTRARQARLTLNLTQAGLEQRSGVNIATIRKFERTGKISLESLLKIAVALDATEEFQQIFPERAASRPVSIDELLKQTKKRQRGRLT